jgi:hypothetical protein
MLPGSPMKMPKSVIDLIWPLDFVAAVVILGELLPRIGLALLHAQADAAALLVDVEHHDFDFLAGVHDLGRIDVLVGPIHFRYVHQAFHAVLDFHEAAVVGNVGDLAEHARVRRIAARNVCHGSAPSCFKPSETR